MNTTLKKMKKQEGFTLIEIAIVLLILGILVGAALWSSGGKTDGARVTNLNNYIGGLAADVRKYGTSGNYGTASLNQVLIDTGKIPSEFTVSGTTITHTLGGNMVVTGKSANFAITTTGLSKSACVDHVTGLAAGFVRFFVDTSATPPATVSSGGTSGSVTAIAANTLCANATSNSVHFIGR